MGYRSVIIKIFTFLGGIYFFLEFLLPADISGFKFGKYDEPISQGFTAVVSMAVGIGIINLLFVHGSRIAFRRSGWIHSTALLLGLGLMTFITVKDWIHSGPLDQIGENLLMLRDFSDKIERDRESGSKSEEETQRRIAILVAEVYSSSKLLDESLASPSIQALVNSSILAKKAHTAIVSANEEFLKPSYTAQSDLPAVTKSINALALLVTDLGNQAYEVSATKRFYSFLYDGLFVSLGSAMFSLLACYMAGAAYRAFRIRSAESALMMTAALLVMLGQIPFGLWIWEGFPAVRLWLLSTPSTAAFRAIKLGAAVAGLIIAFRMWFSIEGESFEEKRG